MNPTMFAFMAVLSVAGIPFGFIVWIIRAIQKKSWPIIGPCISLAAFGILIASMLLIGPTSAAPPSTTILPLPSPTPDYVTVGDIERAHRKLTDLQWAQYRQDSVGERIRFSGTVSDIGSGGTIYLNDSSRRGLLTAVGLHHVHRQDALEIDKGDFIQGVGRIQKIGTLLGLIGVEISVSVLER